MLDQDYWNEQYGAHKKAGTPADLVTAMKHQCLSSLTLLLSACA